MKVFFDTNVLIDAFTLRDYSYKDSRDLIIKVANKEIDGYLSSKQITDIYYSLRKYVSDEDKRKQIIKDVMQTFTVLPCLPSDLQVSVKSKIDDFEDAVIEEIAKVNMIEYIVTSNIKHFTNSSLVIISPNDLNKLTNI